MKPPFDHDEVRCKEMADRDCDNLLAGETATCCVCIGHDCLEAIEERAKHPARSGPTPEEEGGAMTVIEIVKDAGAVGRSADRWFLASLHKTLKIGDCVVMTGSPDCNNLLLRESDMTLHQLRDLSDDYVKLTRWVTRP